MKKAIPFILIALALAVAIAFTLTGCAPIKKDCEHVYDNTCDAICNLCGEARTDAHSFADATCIAPETCECGATRGELNRKNHSSDGGICERCGVIDSRVLTPEELRATVSTWLAEGSTDLPIYMSEAPECEIFSAIRNAILDTPGIDDGSVSLTLEGVKTIPDHSEWGENGKILFGMILGNASNGITGMQVVTQLGSVSLTDAITLGDMAFFGCQNLSTLYAPKLEKVGVYSLANTALEEVELPEATELGEAAFSSVLTLKNIILPKVTVLNALSLAINNPKNELNIYLTSPDEITFNAKPFSVDYRTNPELKVTLVLNVNKKDQVTGNAWNVTNKNGKPIEFGFTSIQYACLDGTKNHASSIPKSNGDNTHTYGCGACGLSSNESCFGGNATCFIPASCEVCGNVYGERADHLLDTENGLCSFGCGTMVATYKYDDDGKTVYGYDITLFKGSDLDGAVFTLLEDERVFGWGIHGNYTLDTNGYDFTPIDGSFSVYADGGENSRVEIQNSGNFVSEIHSIRIDKCILTIGSSINVGEIHLFSDNCTIDLTNADFKFCELKLKEGSFDTSMFILGDYVILTLSDDEVAGELNSNQTYVIKHANFIEVESSL